MILNSIAKIVEAAHDGQRGVIAVAGAHDSNVIEAVVRA